VLQAEGRRVRAVRLLTSGGVRLRRGAQHVGRLDAPAPLGLLELLAGLAAGSTAVADEPTTSLLIDDAALLDVLEDDIGLVIHLRTALGRLLAAREAELGAPSLAAPALPAAPEAPPPSEPSFVDRLLWLQRAPALRRLGVAVLAAMLRDARDVRLAAGDTLFEAGTTATELYVVTHGTLEGRAAADASPLRIGAGAILAENAALAGVPHAFTAVATAPALLLAISGHAFWDIAEDHIDVGQATLAACARRLLQLDAQHTPAAAAPRTRNAA
jgi:CRP-like cAMP-binding protein